MDAYYLLSLAWVLLGWVEGAAVSQVLCLHICEWDPKEHVGLGWREAESTVCVLFNGVGEKVSSK